MTPESHPTPVPTGDAAEAISPAPATPTADPHTGPMADPHAATTADPIDAPTADPSDAADGAEVTAAPAAGPGFADLGLPDALLRTLADDGYETPSAIQAAIIPHLLDGRDVIGQAQTGTGKTAAFALPILARIFADRESGGAKKSRDGGRQSTPSVLVLAPTRELAIQVSDAFGKYARNLGGLRTLAVYGGADMRSQQVALHRGVDVVVGTPGRVMDHMRRGSLDVSKLQTLVLDEADEMLRMGFVDDVEWVLGETPPGRQVALFSATMPREIQSIAEKQLNNPERIKTMGGSKTADTVTQRYWRVQGTHKMDALCRLLAYEDVDAAIVFVRTRAATAEVARGLQEAGYPAAALSGDIAQAQRERTVNELRSGRLKLIVATDVAARGIDIDTVTHVFNYDIPHDTEAYIHRIGRTGRAGREGNAILFVNNRERHLLKNIERATGGTTIEKMDLPTAEDLHALQLGRFGTRLKERLTRNSEPAALRGYIEELCEETGRDPLDVAAFLIGPAMAGVGIANPAAQPPANPHHAPDRGADRGSDRGPRPDRRPPSDPDGPKDNYRVAIGERDGLRAGHLVGAICNETGLDGNAIGAIRIHESYATVELPAGMPRDVADMLARTVVLGRPLRLKPADERGGFAPDRSRPAPRSGPPAKRPPTHRPPAHHAPKPARPAPSHTPPPAPAGDAAPAPRPKPASKPGAPGVTVKSKFKPKTKFKAGPPSGKPAKPGAKPFKSKFKPAGKPAGKSGPVGKPGAGVKRKSDGGHNLSPAPSPFAGGQKPKRYNKRPKS